MAKRTAQEWLASIFDAAAGHLDNVADAHNGHAGNRADQATIAGRQAVGHHILGLLGRDESRDRAAELQDAADEHTIAALGHTLTELVARGASMGLSELAAQLRGAGEIEAADAIEALPLDTSSED